MLFHWLHPSHLATFAVEGRPLDGDDRRRFVETFGVLTPASKDFRTPTAMPWHCVEEVIGGPGETAYRAPRGVMAAVRGFLKGRGRGVVETPPTLRGLEYGTEHEAWNPRLKKIVAAAARGKVVVASRRLAADAAAQIVEEFRRSNVLVVVNKGDMEFRSAMMRTTKRLLQPAVTNPYFNSEFKAVVTTWQDLGLCGTDWADIVVLVEPQFCRANAPSSLDGTNPKEVQRYCPKLAGLTAAAGRLFAVFVEGATRTPLEFAIHSLLFGFDSARFVAENRHRKKAIHARDAYVLWARPRPSGCAGGDHTPSEGDRTAASSDPPTAARVATLARALESGNHDVIRGSLDRIPNPWVAGRWMNVVVYVRSTDDAEALRKHLPGWTIYSTDGPPPVVLEGVICTESGAETLGGIAIDVLLRADFGVGVPDPLAARWTCSRNGGASPLYVVDFVVDGSTGAVETTHSRRNGYLDANWPEWDIDPDVHAYRLFYRGVTPRTSDP